MTDLSVRDTALREYMDDPDCDPALLTRTYRDFRTVNRLISGWRRIYRRHIRPHLDAHRTSSLLDIGSGGGDIPAALAAWAAHDGCALSVTAIDPDPRAHAHALQQHRARSHPPGHASVRFRCDSSADLVSEGASFDFVTSNHLLHHLNQPELADVLADSQRLARTLVLHSDIARSRRAYAAYWVATLPRSRGSYVRVDGLRSIRRSYQPEELAAAAGQGWSVARSFPSRLLLTAPGGSA